MKRRHFLLSGIAGLLGIAGLRFATSSDEAAIVKVLYKKLGYLTLDEAGVHRFAHDLSRTQSISRFRLRLIDAAGPVFTHTQFAASNEFNDTVRHGEERILTLYLLSTDFFRNGADENRTLNYVALYDPQLACGNPFARPAIEQIAG